MSRDDLNRVVGPVVIDENPAMEDLEDAIKKISPPK